MTEKKEPRVFVLQKQTKYDVSAAKYYTKSFVYIADNEKISPFDTYALIELIEHKLKVADFDPDVDFICLTGASVLLSLFLATIVRKYSMSTTFKLLIYDARKSKYQLRLMAI